MICKHCRKVIERSYSKYDNGWRHKGGGVLCRQNMAEPLHSSEEAAETQGEPSDTQVLAALNAYYADYMIGPNKSLDDVRPPRVVQDMRAALRAASEAGGEGR